MKNSNLQGVALPNNFASEPSIHGASSVGRNIPSLDGLRALSILLVMLSHSAWYFPAWVGTWLPFELVIGNGRKGVDVFFVISGFLITTLLMREREKTGTISLKRFYFRRSFRIFPPFYVFIGVMGVLWAAGWIPEHWPSFLAAATYTWTYYPFAHGYEIAHTWSLSIEEQFYLFWPLACLYWFRGARQLAVVMILAMPVVRLAFYFLAPGLRGQQGYMLQEWIDAMMVGCLLALMQHHAQWRRWHLRNVNGWVAAGLAVVGFLGVPGLEKFLPHLAGRVLTASIGPSITALCVGGILVFVTEHPSSAGGRLLNWAPVRHVGVISYSLYLWQQVFVSHEMRLLPWGFVWAVLAAEASYWLVERPSLRLRDKLEPLFGFGRAARNGINPSLVRKKGDLSS